MIKTMQVFDTVVLTVGTPVLLTATKYISSLGFDRSEKVAGIVGESEPLEIKVHTVHRKSGPNDHVTRSGYITIPIDLVTHGDLKVDLLYTLERASLLLKEAETLV